MDVIDIEVWLQEICVYELLNVFLDVNVVGEVYVWVVVDLVVFWEEVVCCLEWVELWCIVYEWELLIDGVIFVVWWFVGGRFNVVVNCVDCYVEVGWGEKVVLYFEGEFGDCVFVIYVDFQQWVLQVVNVFMEFGIELGDWVVIYFFVFVEMVVIMFVCVWIGVVYLLVFGGFFVEVVCFCFEDMVVKLFVISDGQFWCGMVIEVKLIVDFVVVGFFDFEYVFVLC